MTKPFIGVVLDLVGPEVSTIACGCQILHEAIAPVIGIGSPTGCLEHVTRYFHSILTGYQEHTLARPIVEKSIYDVFDLAGERKFELLCHLPL